MSGMNAPSLPAFQTCIGRPFCNIDIEATWLAAEASMTRETKIPSVA